MNGTLFFGNVIQMIFSMSTVVTFDVDANIYSPNHFLQNYNIKI